MNKQVPYEEAHIELKVNQFSRKPTTVTLVGLQRCTDWFTKISAGFSHNDDQRKFQCVQTYWFFLCITLFYSLINVLYLYLILEYF